MISSSWSKLLTGTTVVFACALMLFGQAAPAQAVQGIPYLINFQGRLTDASGNILSDGWYNVKLRIFDATTGGSNLFQEDRVYNGATAGPGVGAPYDNRVHVVNGLFSVRLGEVTTGGVTASVFNSSNPRYLEIELPSVATNTCDNGSVTCSPTWSEGPFTPRHILGASPYAFNSDSLDGLDSAAFAQVAAANTLTGTNTFSKSSGAAIILSGTPASAGSILQVGSTLSSGHANGTLIGSNGAFTGDLLNLQVSNATKLKVDNSGNLTLAGTTITINGSTGATTTCSGGQFLQDQTVVGGITTGGTCAAASGSGASLTLNNLTSPTAVNQDLIAGSNNTKDLGTAATVWRALYTAAVDAGSTTTALTVGTTNATAITVGKSGTTTTFNGPVTLAANQGLTMTSGTGTFSQTYSATSGTAHTVAVTDSSASGTTTVKAQAINLTGTNTSGTNNIYGLDFASVTNPGGTNNFYGLNFGTGYTDLLRVNGVQIIDGSGVVKSAGLSGSYTGVTGTGTLTAGALGSGFTAVNVAQGGTGTNTLSANGILQGNGTSAVSAIAPGGTGTVLLSNGTTASFTTISNTSLSSGTYSNITGVGALAAGSIASGFGTIATTNSITTSSNISTTGSGTITSAGAITAPTATNTINGLVVNSGALSGITGYTQTSGTHSLTSSTTTGDISSITDTALAPAAAASANLLNAIFTAGSTNTSGNSTTNGLLVQPTIATSGAGGTKAINGVAVAAPTITSCTGGTCTIDSLKVTTIAAGAAASITSQGLDIQATGIGAGILTGLNISAITGGSGTETALAIGSGWDNVLTVNGSSIINGSGVVQSAGLSGSYTGITGTGALAAGSLTTGFTAVNVAQGGTGTNTLSANGILQGNGTSAVSAIAPGGSGTVLVSNGTTASFTTISNTSLSSGTYSNITGVGALAAGSIASGFGSIATANTISTSSNISTTGSGTITSAGAITAPTATNTINGLIINGGALTGITGLTMASGAFLQSGTGTFDTGTGAVALNGATNVATNKAFTANGDSLFKDATDGATAFRVQNSTSDNILAIDTSGSNTNNLVGNDSFESALAAVAGNWQKKGGSETVFAQSTTYTYDGANSLKITTTTGATDGAKQQLLTTLSANTKYSASFYVRLDANTTAITDLAAGISSTGASDNNACTLNTNTVIGSGWTRVVCNVTTDATTPTSSNYFYIKKTGATAETFYVDAVLLQTDANTENNYRDGKITVQGTIVSPLILQNTNNSTNALTVQNSAGTSIFNVDTTDTNTVDNPGFESSTNNWALKGSATGLTRDTSKAYLGTASGKFTTTVTSGDGLRYTFPTQLPAATYTISAYVQTSAADSTFNIGYNNGSDVNCVTITPTASATVPTTTGWTRFTCTTATSAVLNSIYITSGTTAVTLNIDSIQVESGAAATAYGAGSIFLNGTITSPVVFKNSNNSTTALQVQNSSGTTLFSVDSQNTVVNVGSGTTDATQVNLQLDSFSTFADSGSCTTTANQGALYYNTNTNAIRSCVNANWEDVMTTAGMGIIAFGVVPDSGNQPGDLVAQQTASVSGPCKVSASTSSTTQVVVQPCTAYSSGRKVIVSSITTLTLTSNTTTNIFQHVCFVSGAIALTAASPETSGFPSWSPSNPALCIADVKGTNATNVVTAVYDTRVFTTTSKEFVTSAAALGIGIMVKNSGAGVAAVAATTANQTIIQGVVVASSGAASVSNAPSAIIATAGSAFVKASAGAAGAIVTTTASTAAGYGLTAAVPGSATAWANLGYTRVIFPASACSAGVAAAPVNCDRSLYVMISIK